MGFLGSVIYALWDGDQVPPRSDSIPTSANAAGFPTKHDKMIKASVLKHWPVEWKRHWIEWRAQLASESSLDERSCEKANEKGAKCLAQILPSTAKDVERESGIVMTRSSVEGAIFGGAYLMAKYGKFWIEPNRSEECRRDLTRASFISGPGNIRKGQIVAREKGFVATCLDEIGPQLPYVISKNNAKTVDNYIVRIRELTIEMTPEG